MDRFDEKKDIDSADEVDGRSGDVLGLSGAAVPKMPGDPSASSDPASARQRRERALGADDQGAARADDPYRQSPGATGIDMGAGGRGTDVTGE